MTARTHFAIFPITMGPGSKNRYEVIIVGCGIAGASLAYFLTERGVTDVLILEREEQPGYHATGRSAAVLVELDPIFSIFQLKALSAAFLRDPPDGFSEYPLLDRSGILVMFRKPIWNAIKELSKTWEQAGVSLQLLSPSEVLDRIPVVSPDHFDGGVWLPEDGHIDVHELLSGYLRHARRRGAELRCNVEVRGIRVERGRCSGVVTNAGEFQSRWVVDSAGAWAGKIAKLAGAAPIEITPKRRTIITFAGPVDIDTSTWPLVANLSHELYFSPESGGIYASPMDEDPMEPCDAHPDELVVAMTIDRIEKLAPRLAPKSIRRKWAGLRTFAPDQAFVVGEDPLVKGFFWLAGQGGSGIETSPIVGQIAADLIIDGRTDKIDSSILSPMRFESR